MSFFGRGRVDPEGDDPVVGVGARGVPGAAESRLSDIGGQGAFTSTLSASELALLSDLGPEPLAQVLGTSVYRVGWQYLPAEAQWAGKDMFCQLDVVGQAWDQARRNALDRLREEARLVGADAVVGVRLRRGEHDWARRAVDFVVIGTAVRLPGSRPADRAAPLVSDLSAQDYWKLTRGGWGPAGLVAASSVCFVSQGRSTRRRRRYSLARNQELHEFSDGFAAARRAAVNGLQDQARAAGAVGVVGVSLDYRLERAKLAVRGVGSMSSGLSPTTIGIGAGDLLPIGGADKRTGVVITVHSVGTAIRRNGAAARLAPRAVMTVGGASR